MRYGQLIKRTPFRREEREGLLEGLHGIAAIDMLEITEEPTLRFIASQPRRRGEGFEEASFPVSRGTAIVLDGRRALMWVHGTVEAIRRGRHYYRGGNRIPAPLLVTRHFGDTNLGVLAAEIFGLSKMDWNNLEPYSMLPATVQSSNKIARIGTLLDSYGEKPYDYRLFI